VASTSCPGIIIRDRLRVLYPSNKLPRLPASEPDVSFPRRPLHVLTSGTTYHEILVICFIFSYIFLFDNIVIFHEQQDYAFLK
jgi:hypothetical protein